MNKPNQHLDIATTDEELLNLRRAIPTNYVPDLKHWERNQSKDFYLGMVAGFNAFARVMNGKMTAKDKDDYLTKLSIDAALIAGGFGKIVEK